MSKRKQQKQETQLFELHQTAEQAKPKKERKTRKKQAKSVTADWPCMQGEPIVFYFIGCKGEHLPYTERALERLLARLEEQETW